MLRMIRQTVSSPLKALALGLAVLLIGAIGADSAQAGYPCGGYYNFNYGYSAPIYHAPSVHYDTQWHGYSHWTPYRGLHSHGHYDTVPHYTPGHFDTIHNGHLHLNPWGHH